MSNDVSAGASVGVLDDIPHASLCPEDPTRALEETHPDSDSSDSECVSDDSEDCCTCDDYAYLNDKPPPEELDERTGMKITPRFEASRDEVIKINHQDVSDLDLPTIDLWAEFNRKFNVAVKLVNCHNVTIIDAKIVSFNTAICLIDCTNVKITNCRFAGCTRSIVMIRCKDCEVTGVRMSYGDYGCYMYSCTNIAVTCGTVSNMRVCAFLFDPPLVTSAEHDNTQGLTLMSAGTL